jgi:hypothetical protein
MAETIAWSATSSLLNGTSAETAVRLSVFRARTGAPPPDDADAAMRRSDKTDYTTLAPIASASSGGPPRAMRRSESVIIDAGYEEEDYAVDCIPRFRRL